jgi:multicomponent K+:H+ antiporter subunit E
MQQTHQKSRWLPHPILSLSLWLIWLLLNNTFAPGHMVLGAVLAIVIPMLTAGFWQERVCVRAPSTLAKYFLVVLWDILIANVVVAKLILSPNRKLQPGFFVIDLDARHPLAISLLANTISLTPGTVSCDVSADRKQLLVHALHLEDTAATIHDIKTRYEAPLNKVLPPC